MHSAPRLISVTEEVAGSRVCGPRHALHDAFGNPQERASACWEFSLPAAVSALGGPLWGVGFLLVGLAALNLVSPACLEKSQLEPERRVARVRASLGSSRPRHARGLRQHTWLRPWRRRVAGLGETFGIGSCTRGRAEGPCQGTLRSAPMALPWKPSSSRRWWSVSPRPRARGTAG